MLIPRLVVRQGPSSSLDTALRITILKYVLKQSTDAVFAALGDPTRRMIVERLGSGPASVSELAAPLPMSMPAVVQHLHVLEACGLVDSQKVGRVRTYRLVVKRLESVQHWIDQRRAAWESRLERLGDYLVTETPKENQE